MVLSSGGKDGLSRPDRVVLSSSNEDSLLNIQNELLESVCQEFIDDAILNVVFEVHKDMKRGLLSVEDGLPDDDEFCQVNIEGLDVFGHAPIKKQYECECPNCSRNLAASRFAPHLEKCMGMGRNSSRIASRRIQNSTREHNSNVGHGSDFDDDDEEWVEKKRRKRDKNSPRRSRALKIKADSSLSGNNSNGSTSVGSVGSSNGTNSSNSSIESILLSSCVDDKRTLFSQMCGVISEHTGRMCTRSLRCPQHTAEQRKNVREQMLPGVNDTIITGSRLVDSTTCSTSKFLVENEESQLDADSLDHEGPISSSWDHDLSNTTSPADSTSTNNSSSTGTSTSSSTTKRSSSSAKSKKKSSKKRDLISD